MFLTEDIGPADVFVAVFGAGILLFILMVLLGTAWLYFYNWIKGNKDW